jgi:hypothetical protein
VQYRLQSQLSSHCRSSEISEKCIRHHVDVCVLSLRDAVWQVISGEHTHDPHQSCDLHHACRMDNL